MQNNMALARLCVAGMIVAGWAGVASAQAVPDRFGIQFAGGVADRHVKKADLGVVWDPNLTWWNTGSWHFALVAEGHLALWHTDEGNVHPNIVEVGVSPIFRFEKNAGAIRPYLEAGVGLRVISHPRITSNYTLSTGFQFADTIGAGAKFGDRQQYQLGYRFQHLSNASIKHPNPGINFNQVYVQYNF